MGNFDFNFITAEFENFLPLGRKNAKITQFSQLVDNHPVSKNITESPTHSCSSALSSAANGRVVCVMRACHLLQTTASSNTNEHLSCGKWADLNLSPYVSLAASHPKRQFLPPSFSLLSGRAGVGFGPTMRKKLADDFNNPLSTNAFFWLTSYLMCCCYWQSLM